MGKSGMVKKNLEVLAATLKFSEVYLLGCLIQVELTVSILCLTFFPPLQMNPGPWEIIFKFSQTEMSYFHQHGLLTSMIVLFGVICLTLSLCTSLHILSSSRQTDI